MAPSRPVRQISTLPLEQQEQVIARMKRAGKLPGTVNPQVSRGDRLWCGHAASSTVMCDPHTGSVLTVDQAKACLGAIEVCGECRSPGRS